MAEEKEVKKVVTGKATLTLESVVARKFKIREKSFKNGARVMVSREIKTRTKAGKTYDITAPAKAGTYISKEQFEKMPLYYVRKHALWPLLEDLTQEEMDLIKSVPAQTLIGYYRVR